jgi:hypothetical protein
MSTLNVAGILSLISMMLLPVSAMAGSFKNIDNIIQNHTGTL